MWQPTVSHHVMQRVVTIIIITAGVIITNMIVSIINLIKYCVCYV